MCRFNVMFSPTLIGPWGLFFRREDLLRVVRDFNFFLLLVDGHKLKFNIYIIFIRSVLVKFICFTRLHYRNELMTFL